MESLSTCIDLGRMVMAVLNMLGFQSGDDDDEKVLKLLCSELIKFKWEDDGGSNLTALQKYFGNALHKRTYL